MILPVKSFLVCGQGHDSTMSFVFVFVTCRNTWPLLFIVLRVLLSCPIAPPPCFSAHLPLLMPVTSPMSLAPIVSSITKLQFPPSRARSLFVFALLVASASKRDCPLSQVLCSSPAWQFRGLLFHFVLWTPFV